MLTPQTVNGQATVRVRVNGVQRNMTVGRLVCEAFHGPPPTPAHIAEHIDENMLNNHADNLQWTTRRASVIRTHKGKPQPSTQGEQHHAALLTWEAVHIIRQEYARGFASQAQLARRYGVSSSTIHLVITGKTWRDPDYTPPAPRT